MATTHEGSALDISSKHLEKLLKDLPDRIQRKVINSAASAGATVVVRAAKQNIKANGSYRTGTLHDSIRKKKKRGTHGVYQVFSDKSAGHSHLVEFGTGPRKLKKPGYRKIGKNWVWVENTGSVSAKPFFRPALDENHQRVMKRIVEQMAKRMAKETEKMAQNYRTLSKSYRRQMAK